MHVVVWNMGKRRGSWDYLRQNASEFDVALLQETRDPAATLEDQWNSIVWRPYSQDPDSPLARWGSAVVAPELDLEQCLPGEAFPWLRELDGCVAIARSAEDPVWFASVHAQASPVRKEILERNPWKHIPRSLPNRRIWETDLIPYELHELFGKETFVWGGDLNSAEVMDDLAGFAGGNRRLREIWAEAGSRDLRLRFSAEEQRTFFAGSRGAYQLDHVFGDAATEARVVGWRVDADPAIRSPALSDHAPIWVELR